MENKPQKFEISRRFPMDFMLKQLLIVLVLLAVTPYIVGIVLALLAKLRLLPLAVCGLVLSCLPNGRQRTGRWPLAFWQSAPYTPLSTGRSDSSAGDRRSGITPIPCWQRPNRCMPQRSMRTMTIKRNADTTRKGKAGASPSFSAPECAPNWDAIPLSIAQTSPA